MDAVRARCEGDAGDAGVIVEDADVLPAVEEGGDGFALAEAELQGEQAVGGESGVGLRDKAAIDAKAVGTGEEGEVGFVVDYLGLEVWRVGEGDVGRVGDDGVEEIAGVELGREGGEEVRLGEANAVGEVKTLGIVSRDGQGSGGDVGCSDLG